MNAFFNEKSLNSSTNIDHTLRFVSSSVKFLNEKGFDVFTDLHEFKTWFSDWENDFDHTAKVYGHELLKKFQAVPDHASRHYFYFFTHEDFGSSIGQNISHSSMAQAARNVLEKKPAAVLNTPDSVYAKRSHLPILRSSHDCSNKDDLILVPCFHNSVYVARFLTLEKIVGAFPHALDQNKFVEECLSHLEGFDFSAWQPKTYIAGTVQTLLAGKAFPISSCTYVTSQIALLCAKGSTAEKRGQHEHYGDLVLRLNYYTKNSALSRHYGRDIYEAGQGNSKLLISLDLENGCFEVIDQTGSHIGVYAYDGALKRVYTDQTDLDRHSLLDIPSSMFLFP